MGAKRPFADVESQNPGQAAGGPSVDNPKRRKQFGFNKHKAKEGTSEFAKKRVRNIERLLQRKQDLPANVRNDLERELASHRVDIADKGFQRKRSAMISKYHMVRFFGTLVKQLQRQIEKKPDSKDMDNLKKELHVAEVDEAYTLYHPHVEPYISLYGNAKSADDDEKTGKTPAARIALKAERPPMWTVVEKTMGEGQEALKRLRERRSADESKPKPKRAEPKTSTAKSSDGHKQQEQNRGLQPDGKANVAHAKKGEQPPLNRRERRRLMREAGPVVDDSDGGDGGFFEEG
ncbi:rRNA-processing protein efg1 [Tolypocladium ophioglossoides CBS 100239]|uniref:rRNA-processing protein EFG1 n=1 Tax=Tolypocladium ophioglossoides (strain CBS 100239) TaxID=1163406 RepID=A0A0L0NLA6_TOLOC|nr:rRNA-processing protein efg1 [Tolypocladium ophioglossoides CBS 100239]